MDESMITLDYMLPVSVRIDVQSGEVDSILFSGEDMGVPVQVFTGLDGVVDGEELNEYIPLEHPVAVRALKIADGVRLAVGQFYLPFVPVDERGNEAGEPTYGTLLGEDSAKSFIAEEEARHRRYDNHWREQLKIEQERGEAARDVELTSLAETPISPGRAARPSALAEREQGPEL